METIFFIDTVHEALWQKLMTAKLKCIDATSWNSAQLIQALPEATGIVIRARFTLNEDLLKHAPNLKFIARSGAGMENIDVAYCEERGIILFNAPEGNRNAVAEHALGMLLSLLNKLHTANRDVHAGKWEREFNRGEELDGKTVGIIGYGNNGSAFARKLRGFDVKVLVYDKYKSGFGDAHITETDLNTIFREADVVSLHIPQNEETLYWVDHTFLSQFQRPIWLLNLSRGKIVRTKDLVAALKSGKVKGAGLDVLEFEKASFESFFDGNMPDEFQELLQLDQVILSPHVGGWTHESYRKLSEVLAEKILNKYS